MLIGFDFDNTIACYDRAIIRLADEIFDLPDDVPRNKIGLRDYLRREDREPEWTAFQGELYGPGMRYAEPFVGALETMTQLKTCGHEMVIVSHRSLNPYAGKQYDLHQAARDWVAIHLQRHGFFADGQIYFLETRDAKIATICLLGCDVFLDDLPEVLDTPNFPVDTLGVLFNPTAGETDQGNSRLTISRWRQFPNLLN
jgi:hypothetical protein